MTKHFTYNRIRVHWFVKNFHKHEYLTLQDFQVSNTPILHFLFHDCSYKQSFETHIAKLPQPKLRQPTDAQTFQCAKLPQPKLRQSTDVQRSQRTLRAAQVRCALVRAYVELLQNRPLQHLL
jgi:hypothetical protein